MIVLILTHLRPSVSLFAVPSFPGLIVGMMATGNANTGHGSLAFTLTCNDVGEYRSLRAQLHGYCFVSFRKERDSLEGRTAIQWLVTGWKVLRGWG